MKILTCKILPFFLLLLAFPVHAQTDVLHLKSDVVDTIFGKAVADPYRWMEHLGSDSVKQWLLAQKKITKAEQKYFNGRMADAATNMERNSGYSFVSEEKTGPWYFQLMSSLNVFYPFPILYYRENTDDHFAEAFNPNDLDGHEKYTIRKWELSDNSRLLAVALSDAGSDWMEIRVRDLHKQKDLTDRISHVKFSEIVWWQDGFFYTGYKASGQTSALGGQQLYYHKLGESQEHDVLLMSVPASPGYSAINIKKTSNKQYLIINKNQKIGNEWYNMIVYKDLKEGLYDEWKIVVQSPAKNKADFDVIDYTDSGFIIKTTYNAAHGRILLGSATEANHFKEIITEQDLILKKVTFVHHELVCVYFTAGQYQVCMFNMTGKLIHALKFEPGIEVEGFNGSPDDSEAIFYENTFYVPTMAERYDFKTNTHTSVGKTKIGFDEEKYETEVVNYKSKDGTEVSMYLTHKRGLKLENNNPVILYSYGGFGRSITPSYSYSNIIFFDNNGILAVPMIRGGGELGADWHEGGQKLKKQNSFDDFTAAAQYLIKQGYTSKERLAIEGRTDGPLVASVMLQHPELFQVVVACGGVYDMLRFPQYTAGKYWLNEYGDPSNALYFDNLLSYSPVHNVKKGIAYPASLFIAGKNDDRVVPFHTYKLLARLQECSAGNAPHILFFEEEAGHNGATNRYDWYDQDSFILAFIFTEMGLSMK